MPDELRSYVGCHESSSQAPETGKSSACPETQGRNAFSPGRWSNSTENIELCLRCATGLGQIFYPMSQFPGSSQ